MSKKLVMALALASAFVLAAPATSQAQYWGGCGGSYCGGYGGYGGYGNYCGGYGNYCGGYGNYCGGYGNYCGTTCGWNACARPCTYARPCYRRCVAPTFYTSNCWGWGNWGGWGGGYCGNWGGGCGSCW